MVREGVQQKLDELIEFIEQAEETERLQQFMAQFNQFVTQMRGDELQWVSKIFQEHHEEGAIYQEIGHLVREYHNQLKGLEEQLPRLIHPKQGEEVAEVKNRLQYILQLTEKSANQTMDLTEKIQVEVEAGSQERKKVLEALASLLENEALTPQGAQTLKNCIQQLHGLEERCVEHQKDLGEILIAQNYQDLTGQVIQKIAQLMQNLELDLAKMIEKYGSTLPSEMEENSQLQGPLEKPGQPRANQLDVDQLLAQHGF